AEIEPALRPPGPDTMTAWFPDEAYLLTEPLIERLIARAAAHGATLQAGEQGRVTGLDAAPGRAPGARTPAGAVLPPDEGVCCAGRWTPGLAALAGAPGTVPLVAWDTYGSPAPALVVRVGPVTPAAPVRVLHAPGIFLRPHPGGLAHLEAPDTPVDLHTPEAGLRARADELLRRARRTVRGLDEAGGVAYQVCGRPPPAAARCLLARVPCAERHW